MTQKEIKRRSDLEGLEIVYKDENILISEAWESIWQNPNHKDFFGKKVLQIAGYKNVQIKDGKHVGRHIRIVMLESDLIETT